MAIQQLQQNYEANRQRNAQLQQQQQDYSSSINERSRVNSNVMAGATDAIVGRDNYRAPDGGVLKVDTQFDNVYSRGDRIYATKGIELDHNNYQPLQRLPNVLP